MNLGAKNSAARWLMRSLGARASDRLFLMLPAKLDGQCLAS
jgi:hypothetical protein